MAKAGSRRAQKEPSAGAEALAEANSALRTVRLSEKTLAQSALGEASATATNGELACRVGVDIWAERAFAAGTRVGRYQIREALASGGMGTVYRAHDTSLSRDVALKVLHERYLNGQDAIWQAQRLLREAQALAQLSHPNVVAAYDVGEHADALFVAMELVPGDSLQNWLKTARRGRTESLRALIAAGRGLAAAHAAGVMHRDFKPSNVMVSPDGRVRVIDFGLARAASTRLVDERARCGSEAGASLLSAEVTELGTVLGTPGYVAPERLRGERLNDARSDQFSFAVTAFIVLTGTKPYPGTTMPSYAAGLSSGQRAPWPASVPRRLRAVVDRGLALLPEQRYPDVAALVDALERASAPRHRVGILAFALGSLPLLAFAFAVNRRSLACEAGGELFQTVWDADRRAALERAFLASPSPNGRDAFAQLSKRLDAYEAKWLEQKRSACAATRWRGEQSEKILALREACLEHKRQGVAAMVSAFTVTDPAVVDRGAGAVPEPLGECADAAALLGSAERMPKDPALAARVAEIQSGLAVARAWMSAGRSTEAMERARQNLEAARAIGHRPSIAEALASLARITYAGASSNEERNAAEALLRDAIRVAAEVGDERLVAASSSQLFLQLCHAEHRVQEAEAMLPMVEALIIRAGNDPQERLEVELGRAVILAKKREHRAALPLFRDVIERSRTLDADPSYAAEAQRAIDASVRDR